MGIGLIVVIVSTFAAIAPAQFWIILSLLLYILHQIEEHTGDRFRLFVNTMVLQGKQALTPRAVMVINVGLVWVLMGVCLLAATYLAPAIALVPLSLCWINALVHIVPAIASRRYNPGLATALVLLFPAGLYGYALLAAHISWTAQAGAISFVVAMHLGIVAHVARRAAALKA